MASIAVPSIVREFDFFKIENDVNAALQPAANGKLFPKPVSLASLPLPSNALTEKATKWAHEDLDPAVFAHSLRTYYFGTAIATENFQDFGWDPETLYLAAILHDIKCTHKAFRETALSFEIYGGLTARAFLLEEGASKHVADTVMEAICRHTSHSVAGYSPVGQILRFGLGLDVHGTYASLINTKTISDVVAKYPRNNFNNVFPDLLMEEAHVKHYCMQGVETLKPGVADSIRHNPVMAPYDD